MRFTRRSLAITAGLLLGLASLTFTPNQGTAAAAPSTSTKVHLCHTDCGVTPDDTPTDVTAAIRQQQRDSGDYLGPATRNAVSGNTFAH